MEDLQFILYGFMFAFGWFLYQSLSYGLYRVLKHKHEKKRIKKSNN